MSSHTSHVLTKILSNFHHIFMMEWNMKGTKKKIKIFGFENGKTYTIKITNARIFTVKHGTGYINLPLKPFLSVYDIFRDNKRYVKALIVYKKTALKTSVRLNVRRMLDAQAEF